MIDRIIDPTVGRAPGIRTAETAGISVYVRNRRQDDRSNPELDHENDQRGRESDSESGAGADRRKDRHFSPSRPGRNPYTDAQDRRKGPVQQDVLTSRSALILSGNLNSVLQRSNNSLKLLASSLFRLDEQQIQKLLEAFEQEALEWVRVALMRHKSFDLIHDSMPVGLIFDDVTLSVDHSRSNLSISVGNVEFRQEFSFKAEGVVFDIRATGAVDKPTPGFFVDIGRTGGHLADVLTEYVRRGLPRFAEGDELGGVCVLIRAQSSKLHSRPSDNSMETQARWMHIGEQDWVLDFDIFAPFDPNWKG